jgi:signal transduction histidine kinase
MPFALPVGRVRRARQRLHDEHHLLDVLLASAAGDVLLSTSANPVNDERGRRSGAVAVFEDVTEQRAREAQMRASLRASPPPRVL